MKSAQEVFDTVIRHLVNQRKASVNGYNGECVYRGPDGTKCAVGCLIPDEVYNVGMEGKNVYDLLHYAACNEINLPEEITEHRALLKNLQDLHDDYLMLVPIVSVNTYDAFRFVAQQLADKHNLSIANFPIMVDFTVSVF